MKTMKKYLKRALTAVLSAAMSISGLPFIMPDVHAEDNSNWREVWQTPDELVDGTYNTSENGKAGYINFGTRPEVKYIDSSSSNQATAPAGTIKWLITGKDTDGNIVLYSEEPLMSANMYDSSSNSIFGEHQVYSVSNFRSQLQRIAESIDYFSGKEQGIMEETTVNTPSSGSTTDKLYGLHSDGFGDAYIDIYAGANNSLPVNIKYWKGWHWLRSPSPGVYLQALVAAPGDRVRSHGVNYTAPAVAAASKLNLSSIIFASAARSAAATATTLGGENLKNYECIYNLRLKDTSNTSQSIQTNAEFTKIRAINVPTSSEYYLMVQGSSSGTNWAYSTKITDGKVMLQASDLSNVASISSFENTKVWIEKAHDTDDGQLLYASALTTISSSTDKFDDKAPCVKSVTLTHQKDGKQETYVPGTWSTNPPITVTYNVEDLAGTGVTPSGIDADSYQISLDGGTSYSKATDSIDGVEVLSRTESELQLKVAKEGQFRLKIRVQDKEGNCFTESEINSLNIDMTPPAPVKITSPEGDTWLKTKTPTISGTGEKGCTVHIKEGDTILGSPEVSEDGTWQLTLDPLAEWIHRLTITQTDPAGQTSNPAKINFIINTEGFAGKIVITDDARVYWIRPGDKSVFKFLH